MSSSLAFGSSGLDPTAALGLARSYVLASECVEHGSHLFIERLAVALTGMLREPRVPP